jgi:hypothetical protein
MLSHQQSSAVGTSSSAVDSHSLNQSAFLSHQTCATDGLSSFASSWFEPSPGTMSTGDVTAPALAAVAVALQKIRDEMSLRMAETGGTSSAFWTDRETPLKTEMGVYYNHACR